MVTTCSVLCLAALVVCAQAGRFARRTGSNSTADDCYSTYDGKALLSLKECASPAEVVSKLEKKGCTFVSEVQSILNLGCDGAEVVCNHAADADLLEIADVVKYDAGAHWRSSSGTTVPFDGSDAIAANFYSNWQGLDAQLARVESLVASSGGIATIETAGRSLQGRDMKLVRFRGAGYSSGRTRIFVTFNLHAREWITGMSGVYAVEYFIEKLKQDSSYLDGTEVVLMPMANPDGFLYSTRSSRMHRKNMANSCSSSNRGVDLNRNFPAHWNTGGSSSNPCSDTYMGPSAASEPETKVIERVMEEAPMTVYIDVHSYSELIISSWGWTTRTHPRNAEYRAIGREIVNAIRSAEGRTWREGPTATLLYQASGIAPDTADEKGALGICFELRPGRSGGGGFAPPANQILPGARECFAGLVAAFDYAKDSSPSPSPPSPTPPSPTPPSPTPPSPTPPSPTPPTGGCVHETDCNVNPWCRNSGYEAWCRQQGQAGACPAPFCKRT